MQERLRPLQQCETLVARGLVAAIAWVRILQVILGFRAFDADKMRGGISFHFVVALRAAAEAFRVVFVFGSRRAAKADLAIGTALRALFTRFALGSSWHVVVEEVEAWGSPRAPLFRVVTFGA